MYIHPAHFKVFCDCIRIGAASGPKMKTGDRPISDENERFYAKRYNFMTNGFYKFKIDRKHGARKKKYWRPHAES
jgi:hypothetical protein